MSRDPTVSRWRRSDWDTVKDDIMLKALRCKFAQHPDLMKKLWETGDRELIEHTANDSYWADGGGKGRGLNKLGKLLMKVRDEIVEVCGPFRLPEKFSVKRTIGLKRSCSLSNLISHQGKSSNSMSSSKWTYMENTESKSQPTGLKRSFSDSSSNSSVCKSGVVKRFRDNTENPIHKSVPPLHSSFTPKTAGLIQQQLKSNSPNWNCSLALDKLATVPAQRFYNSPTSGSYLGRLFKPRNTSSWKGL